MSLWIAILAACLGCYLFKLAGLSVPRTLLERPKVQRISALLPVVLLSALVAVQTFSTGSGLYLSGIPAARIDQRFGKLWFRSQTSRRQCRRDLCSSTT